MEKEWGWRAIGIVKECSGYIGTAETMGLSNRWNGIEKIEERWLESNTDGRDGTWMSLTTALEEEEIWIATLIVHVHTQPQSHPEQWKEMRGRERWVVGGVEWRSGIWDCWWWLLLLCRCVCCLFVPICAVIVFMLFVFSVICLCFHVHTRTSTCIHVIDPLPPNTNSWFPHEKEWIMIW